MDHRERMYLPWWAWLVGTAMAVLLAAEVHMGAPGVAAWLPYVLLVPLAVAGMLWLGRLQVGVAGGNLHVDDATLPLGYVAEVTPLTGTPLRDALSVGLDPLAFVVQRPWVRGAVRVTLDDPADPTPYWIVSSHDPERLVAAIRAGIEGGTGRSRSSVNETHPVP